MPVPVPSVELMTRQICDLWLLRQIYEKAVMKVHWSGIGAGIVKQG